MSTYEEALCNSTTDLTFVLPDLQNYDRKVLLVNWTTEGSNLYSAGSTGNIESLYKNGQKLDSAESSVSAVNADGEWFYNSTTDLLTIYSVSNPTYEVYEGGRDFPTHLTETVNRASEFVRSYINKPIYKRTGTGSQSGTARDYEDIVVRSTALISVAMILQPYELDRAMEIEKLAFDREEGTGYLDLIKRGEIRLWHEVDDRKADGVIRPVAVNSSTTGSIIDLKGRATRGDLIKIKITTPTSSSATVTAGTANSTVKYSTWVGDDTGLKVVATETDRVISGGYDPIGLGMHAKFSMGTYYSADEWECEVTAHDDYPETQQQVKNAQAQRFGYTRLR